MPVHSSFSRRSLLVGSLGLGMALCLPGVALAETALERAKAQGYIRVGFANEAPFGYATPDGKLTGEAPEVAKAVLAKMGIPQVDGVLIQVLNGTSEVGLASQVEDFLEGKGYVAALPAADAAQKPVTTTIVYFRAGDDAEQNEVDADHLAARFLKGVEAQVKPLSAALGSDVAPRTQLVVLLGTDYAEANPVV